MGFGNGTLAFSCPWVGMKGCGAPEALGLVVIISSPWRLISPQGPLWVEANSYSLKVIIWVLGGLIGGLNLFLKYAESLFSGLWCNAISQDKCYPIICELLYRLSEAMVPAIKEFYGRDVCVDI